MTEEEYLKITQTFPTLDNDGGSARYHGEWKFKSLNSVQLKIEKYDGKYISQLEDTSDQYQWQLVYESTDLDDFLQQTKAKLADIFLGIYNQFKEDIGFKIPSNRSASIAIVNHLKNTHKAPAGWIDGNPWYKLSSE